MSWPACFQIPYEAYVHRFTINTRDWSMTRSNILPTHQPIELPMINQAWLTFPYQYAYYTWGIHTGLPQNFTKVGDFITPLVSFLGYLFNAVQCRENFKTVTIIPVQIFKTNYVFVRVDILFCG